MSALESKPRFRARDVVKHGPSGEQWVLACDEERGKVSPCGWPECMSEATDCELVEAASDEQRLAMLKRWAEGVPTDHRAFTARLQLERENKNKNKNTEQDTE